MLLIIIITLFIIYSLLIFYYRWAWKSIPDYSAIPSTQKITVSVIIPARNEEKNIGLLLKALQDQTYPKDLFEVIVVDDHSTDATATIVRQYPFVQLISLHDDHINSYKKKAIETGIAAATGELIVTTDADCLPAANWLKTIVAFKQENKSIFIVAPVVMHSDSSFLQLFQSMDFMILQGITGASVYNNFYAMCNGANLVYEKSAFQEVNGFSGIDTIASGDDMLLMHKIKEKHPDKVHYLKSTDAIVASQPMQTWKDFINQRIRWASKATYYRDNKIKMVLLIVYLFNLFFLVLAVAGFFCYYYWLYLFGLIIAKTIVEFPFVHTVASFFQKKSLMKYFFFFQPIHILYTIIAGLLGQFGTYEWKGRIVK